LFQNLNRRKATASKYVECNRIPHFLLISNSESTVGCVFFLYSTEDLRFENICGLRMDTSQTRLIKNFIFPRNMCCRVVRARHSVYIDRDACALILTGKRRADGQWENNNVPLRSCLMHFLCISFQ